MTKTADTKKKRIVCGALFALFYAGWGAMLYRMFTRQAIEFQGKYGNYPSDLVVHIREGREGIGYSLMDNVFAFLMDTLGLDQRAIGVFLALTVLVTVWATYRVMRRLLPGESSPILLMLLVTVSMFVMPIHIKALNPYRYLSLQSATIWHNATYIGMKLAGMCVMYFYYYYQENYQKHFSAADFIWFTVLLSFANLMKPSFILAFAPAMAVMLLTDCVASKGKTFGRQVLFGIPVLLSLVVLAYQSTKLFMGNDSAIVFAPAYILRFHATHPFAALLQSAAFPLLVLAANFRNLKTDRCFRVSWLIWLFGLLETLLLNETGRRQNDGNFTWGYSFCLFLVFVVCLCCFYRNVKEIYSRCKDAGKASLVRFLREDRGCRRRVLYLAAAGLLLCAHFCLGLDYFRIVSQGGSYF